MNSTFWIDSVDDVSIYVKKWYSNVPKPKVIIQLSHGMAEHIGRYENFANYFLEKDIFVYGHDHRGHGQTGLNQGLLGYLSERDGFDKTMKDMLKITQIIKQEHPNVPIVLLGHSMGSFLARNYLQHYSHYVDGVILSGTGYFPSYVNIPGKALASLLPAKQQSKLMNQLAFGNYNKKIRWNKTVYDWLTRDSQEVKKYLEDPLSGYISTARFFVDLMTGLQRIKKTSYKPTIRKSLPLLFVSGTEDPVGNYGKGVWKTAHLYKNIGLDNITICLFEGARHEVINEINKEEVYSNIYSWLNNCINHTLVRR